MPGTALWVDAFVCLPGFTCLPLSPFICWVDGFICLPLSFLPLSPVVSQPSSPFICLPAWLARLGFICLPLSPSLDAWVDRFTWSPFICGRIWHGSLGGRVHVSPFVPFICLPFIKNSARHDKGVPDILGRQMNPSTQRAAPGIQAQRETNEGRHRETNVHPESRARHPGWETTGEIKGDKGRQMNPSTQRAVPGIQGWLVDHFSPFVSPHLAPVVSQPGCLSRLSRRTDSLVSLGSLSFVGSLGGRIHLSPVVSQPGCVALTLRGFLHFPRFGPFGGVWFAFGFGPGFGHSLSCGCWGQGPPLSALHLDFDFAWARGVSSSLSIVGYTLSVRSVPRYQLRSRADDSGALRCAASATRRLC